MDPLLRPLLLSPRRTFDTWSASDFASGIAVSENGLLATLASGADYRGVRSGRRVMSGKKHFEITAVSGGGANADYRVGVADSSKVLTEDSAGGNVVVLTQSGTVFANSVIVGSSGQYVNGSVLAVEVDAYAKTVKFYSSVNPGWCGDIDYSFIPGPVYIFFSGSTTGYAARLNTGALPFSVPLSLGYEAWGAPA